MWVAIRCSIWLHRNNSTFRNYVIDAEEVFNLVKVRDESQIRFKEKFSYSDWVLCPLECLNSIQLNRGTLMST